MKVIRPRDFLETVEGLLFAVVSKNEAFLRYYPASDGGRNRNGAPYEKVSSTRGSFEYLEKNYPDYVFKKDGRKTQAVPKSHLKAVHSPVEKLESLDQKGGKLIEKCLRLRDALVDIPPSFKGVSGSILIDLATRDSDIDFVVYGKKRFDKARKELWSEDGFGFLNKSDWKLYYLKRFPASPSLSFEDFLWHEKRKGNIGVIGGTLFNLLLVGESLELPPALPQGKVKIKCNVSNDEHSFNIPSILGVNRDMVSSIVCFTHKIEVSGVLEKTMDGDFRIVVGTSREAPGEYIRVLRS